VRGAAGERARSVNAQLCIPWYMVAEVNEVEEREQRGGSRIVSVNPCGLDQDGRGRKRIVRGAAGEWARCVNAQLCTPRYMVAEDNEVEEREQRGGSRIVSLNPCGQDQDGPGRKRIVRGAAGERARCVNAQLCIPWYMVAEDNEVEEREQRGGSRIVSVDLCGPRSSYLVQSGYGRGEMSIVPWTSHLKSLPGR